MSVGNGNGTPKDDAERIIEFVEQAVLTDDIHVRSIQVKMDQGDLDLYAVTFTGKLGDGSGESGDKKAMMSALQAVELIDKIVSAAAEMNDPMFMVGLVGAMESVLASQAAFSRPPLASFGEQWTGDALAQLVYDTLCDRGHEPEAAAKMMEARYAYEAFGRLVDYIEDFADEMEGKK